MSMGTDDDQADCLGALLFENLYATKAAENVTGSQSSAKLAFTNLAEVVF